MDSKKASRRLFLKNGAALAGVALSTAGIASGQTGPNDTATAESGRGSGRDLRAYGERSHFETMARTGNNGRYGPDPVPAGAIRDIGLRAPLQDMDGNITPASVHYTISHGYLAPDINPREHRLMVHGMVDRPLIFTMDELRRLPSVTRTHLMECRANGDPARAPRKAPNATPQTTHGFSSCSVWTGVPLSALLKDAGVQTGGTWIIAEGLDAQMHNKSIPIAKAMEDVILAYGQNGEAVRPDQGYPLRLVVPGYEGINSVKWLRRIKVVDQPYMFKRETADYPELRPDGKARWFNSELGPNSVITRPAGGQHLPVKGFYQIHGLAWSGAGTVRRVEVSTNGGKTWEDAEVQQPSLPKAYTCFDYGWNWNGEETLLKSRCTDERGGVQPTVGEWEKIWSLPAGYTQNAPFLLGHFCVIQTWKVNRDGSVENALFS
jgi:sulfane dehydrogenase subunit SoxC